MNTKKQHINQKTICFIFFVIYAALTFIGALTHECWNDEAQAWCLVRDNDIYGMFDALKFEGHPPLWYLILYPFTRLGFSVSVLPLISWGFSTASAALVCFKSPFKTYLKVFILFSVGFVYYTSIFSRIYCVIIFLLCLIAMLYPERAEHPLIFGLLIGLLAITHVTMSGLVGIIGIYILIDFFRQFKENTVKKRLLAAAGMFIALAGVILLVLPLLSSLSSNNDIAKSPLTADNFFKRFLGIFTCIGSYSSAFISHSAAEHLIGAFVTTLIIAVLFMLRRYPRAVISYLVFSVFFFFCTQIIYKTMLTSRAAIYLYTLIFIIWAAKSSNVQKQWDINIDTSKIENKFLKMAAELIIKTDRNYQKTISIILCAVCAVSVPKGIYMLITDDFYDYDYTGSAYVTEYIKNNASLDDSIFIALPTCSTYCAKLPGLRVYNPGYKRFLTYTTYSVGTTEKKHKIQESYDMIKNYKNIYVIKRFSVNELGQSTQDYTVVMEKFIPREYIFDDYTCIQLCKMTFDEFKNMEDYSLLYDI